jgi:hypothetical protein
MATVIFTIKAFALISDTDAVALVIAREFIHGNSNYDQKDRSNRRNDHSKNVETQSKSHLE